MKRGMDLGGSQLRMGDGYNITTLDANVLEIAPSSKIKEYIQDKCSDFIVENHPHTKLQGRRFVRDEAMDHYHGREIICDNQTTKSEQEILYINISYALARDICTHNLDVTEDTIQIGICIPTSEYYSDQKDYPELVKQNLAGTHTIYFPLQDKRVSFDIHQTDIRIAPEGVVAAFKYKKDVNFLNGVTMIVDVGYRSTDITIMEKFHPIGKSAVSRPKGGINLEAAIVADLERSGILVSKDEIKEALRANYLVNGSTLFDASKEIQMAVSQAPYDWENKAVEILSANGINATKDEVINARRTFWIMQGVKPLDITQTVVTAKANFAASLRRDVVDVLATQMINISSVNNLLPIGRPFSGDPKDPNCLTSLLLAELGGNLHKYDVPNLATANVEEVISILMHS